MKNHCANIPIFLYPNAIVCEKPFSSILYFINSESIVLLNVVGY